LTSTFLSLSLHSLHHPHFFFYLPLPTSYSFLLLSFHSFFDHSHHFFLFNFPLSSFHFCILYIPNYSFRFFSFHLLLFSFHSCDFHVALSSSHSCIFHTPSS
jgi:hypothetical protein